MLKKCLSVLLAATLAMAIFAGCASDSASGDSPDAPAENGTEDGADGEGASADQPSAPVAAGDPVSGGVLTLALSSSPQNLDPTKYTGTYESQIIRNVCDNLVAYKSDLSGIGPAIATEWTVSDDGLEYTFQLREDVYFHPGEYQDGRQVTAEDIKYSLERSNTQSAMNRLDMLDHCEVISEFEVKCVLDSPNSVFLTALTDAGNVIVPKEEVEGWGDAFNTHLVGSGPFILEEFKLDQEVITKRNDKYWAATPYLDGVTFKVITDSTQMVNALKAGDIDYAEKLTGEAVQLVRDDANLNLLETPGLQISYIYFNQVNGPTADKRVRDALAMAIDREDLVKGIFSYGEAVPATVPLPPGSWGYDSALESKVPEYDPEKAKELLAEAGYPDGFSTAIYISNTEPRIRMSTIVQQYLKTNLNVDVEIEVSEWGPFSEVASSGNADIYAMSWSWYPDPFFFLNKIFHSSEIGALGNGAGFNSPTVDKLLDDALLETEQDARAALYQQALEEIMDENPIFVYANENVTHGVRQDVQGVVQRADGVILFCTQEINVWKAQ